MSPDSLKEPPPDGAVAPLPAGTVTFLFTDIQGSTRLLRELGVAYATLLTDHDRLMQEAIERHNGRVFGHEGDAVFAAFADAPSAINAAIDGQRALAAHAWPQETRLRVRMGIHTGQAITRGSGYMGMSLHQAARIRIAPRRVCCRAGRSREPRSYDLLDEPDRRLFERLSVFAGGAGLTQIEEVCGPASDVGGEILDGLGSLVEKSLLRSVPGNGLEPRFAMLATIREYALEHLGERGEVPTMRHRHAAAYVAIAETCAPHLTGVEAAQHLSQLDLEHDNLRAAIEWAVERGDAELAHRFGAALWRFWQVRGHLHEATERIRRILETPGADDLSPALRSRALGAAGSIAYWSADAEGTGRYYPMALEAARHADDPRLLAEATYNAGFHAIGAGGRRLRFAAGRDWFEEALRLYREVDDEVGVANATWALGLSLLAGEDESARELFHESLALYRRVHNRFGEGWALHMIGLMDVIERRPDDAERRFRESAEIFAETEDRSANVLLLLDLALVAKERGELERFWTLAGASDALSKKTGIGLAGSIEDFVNVDPPERPVGNLDAERAWDAGAALEADEAMALALGERRS
ncbi:MAG TPA: adenylate/guanylate cyclase domain-containing protein [Vitreimonas sp.]|nr:adenylate/guanylate cyclase domain-containing protein [Vitreimonas sp.]